MYFDASVVFDDPIFRNRFIKKLTRSGWLRSSLLRGKIGAVNDALHCDNLIPTKTTRPTHSTSFRYLQRMLNAGDRG
jgi:hypothetical protein